MADASDQFDRLADLFLSDPRTAGVDQPSLRLRHPSVIEIALVGHLPVRAGLWLAQYAQHVAASEGPASVLRIEGDSTSLELACARHAVNEPERSSDLAAMIASCASSVRRWIIAPGEANPVESCLHEGVDQVTLLTGADEAAIVFAYRRLKELHAASIASDRPLPALGLAVIGAEPARAREAAARLERTAARHLNLRLALVAVMPKIEVLEHRRHRAYRTPSGHPLETLLHWIDTASETVSANVAPPRREMPPDPAASPDQHRTTVETIDEFDIEREASEAPIIETIRLRPRLRSAVVEVPSEKSESPPALVVEPILAAPVEAMNADRDSLASFIAGLKPLGLPCPISAVVELATAEDGAVHLVADEAGLPEFERVAAWARRHAALLGMAFPNRLIDPAGVVVRHLVSESPSRLTPYLESDLRLHIIAPVEVAGRRAWFTAPLQLGP